MKLKQTLRRQGSILMFLMLLLMGTRLSAQSGSKETFAIGNQTFLLNGQPFVIKAAELHYPRIPKEYWEHRIKMTKALGMNTICIYAFWNIHEQRPGEFDFTGNNDIAEFCRLAQKHGMYIILRPGPYVCAEWEMGGLPWWLLKKKDIQLRTNDPYFLERTEIYLQRIGQELSSLQLDNGGNIIMVQVENEYGSYGIDKPYIAKIRDMVLASGFDKAPLFQCDWSSNFKNNALDGLVWTVNFGTGANIADQFRELKQVAPQMPLMCSEYWSGWFDHWGRKHETRDASAMIDGLREMLDNNISFSLYMTHGGTTFGHWGGANSPAYSAMCSSYDYDAPISEAGWTTPKYFELRQMMADFKKEGEATFPIPSSMPIIEIPEIQLTESAALFDNLPQPILSKDIKPMEEFDQGWGSILYRTTLPANAEETSLTITEVHDWAQVFVDGTLIGRLDRRQGQSTLKLPSTKKGARLDILVEAMGRVNFGKAIHDRKGITEKVEIISKAKTTELKNWEVFNLPVDYAFAKQKKYTPNTNTVEGPAYYRGTFHLDKTGDTFLDFQTWGKGLVYVNGHALGRFWEIGPQQTLFLPGCWLNEGENEIIVWDIKGPQSLQMKGLKNPILDELRNPEVLTHRKEGESLDLTEEAMHYQGEFDKGNGWQEVKFDKKATARYFALEALSSHGGDDFAAIAELDVLGADGKAISRQDWKIVYADSEETVDANNTADKVFDLQESTFWHTAYSANKTPHPHQIVIDLGTAQTISGFRYLPRAESNYPGMIKGFKIYLKETPFVIQ